MVADSSNPPSQKPTLIRSMTISGRLIHAERSWKSSGEKSNSDSRSTSDPVRIEPSARKSPLSMTSQARSRAPKISSPSCAHAAVGKSRTASATMAFMRPSCQNRQPAETNGPEIRTSNSASSSEDGSSSTSAVRKCQPAPM